MNATDFILGIFQVDKILVFIFTVFCIVIFAKAIKHWSEKLQNYFLAKRLIILQVTTIITFVIYLFGTLSAFYLVFKPTREIMVAVGGSAAVAFGFALKDLVGSIIAGFILLFDRPFQVGDRVQFAEFYGEIKNIGLRSVRLQTLDDSLVTIPNSKFLSDAVSSGNSGAIDMMIVCHFYISLFENLERVRDVLHEVVITSRFVYLDKPVSIVFEEVAISNTFVIKASVKAYVIDVKYEKSFLSDLTTRGNKQLREKLIQRPLVNQEHTANKGEG